ncbi:MAG: type II secretion system protein [Planctomycetota bacterium]|nr:type II secretion system protein [Planctomycetota bacterium]
MRRTQVGHKGAGRGFTLVELLLVMGIIVMLVGLLFPAVNAAVTAVRIAATQSTINNLSAGLEAFKQDWGMFPPSKVGKDGWSSGMGSSSDGYAALSYYLVGRDGTGWGSLMVNNPVNVGPFNASASSPYGPYYKAPSAVVGIPDPVVDAFKPGKAVFYYRFEPAATPAYDMTDNKGSGLLGNSADPNFMSQTAFELLIKYLDPTDTGGTKKIWVRTDYLLISAGPDRYWGYMMDTSSSSGVKPMPTDKASDVNSGIAICDDVCNFKR